MSKKSSENLSNQNGKTLLIGNKSDWELLTFDDITKIVYFGILIHVLAWKQKCLIWLLRFSDGLFDVVFDLLFDAVQNSSYCVLYSVFC